MTLDFSDFEKGLANLVKVVEPRETAKGLYQAGNQLLKDAIEQKPYAPFHVDKRKPGSKAQKKQGGHLRRSAHVNRATLTATGAELACGFNIVYAARWHELTAAEDAKINWTLEGVGRKYLEKKMAQYKDDYMKIVAIYLAKILGKANV